MPKPSLAKTLDFFVSLMTDPHSDPAMQAWEMQRAYESLAVSQNGRIRNSEYSSLANLARQGERNCTCFLGIAEHAFGSERHKCEKRINYERT
ncbi:hypothetical protein HY637_02990 [Candidatus Woesearchaeota archaeon]|nr:hypothetical protein [Candidatus Woesearchaeota archaeon]